MTGRREGDLSGADVIRAPFGRLPDGRMVEAITLVNGAGMQATMISLGAAVQSVLVPGRDGVMADVALGHADLRPYLDQPQFLGATVGRVANRIASGRFTLDGVLYQVPVNDGPNALHGGPSGFDKANWEVLEITRDPVGVTFGLTSPDGDQGFPGALQVTATYTLTEANALCVDYRAETDAPTLVNITNHSYWNLAGEGAAGGAMDQLLTIQAEHFLPTDAGAIPTGEIRPVAGTAFDFRTPVRICERVRDARDEQIRIGRGYDHNWVVAPRPALEVQRVARVEHPGSGRVLELLSNQPGLQFYSGNFLDATSMGKAGCLYRMGDAIVLEPQQFPDTLNRPAFGSLRLDPGETYHNRMVFRFSVAATR
ncbi:aldose 1-epimerase [Polymorphobacter multimanifer]|uniref:Aldose 1-epimerase n=1 Tax=Polymorphobacter multimanifer TaxID=1070431 RepID=A0A841L4K1_9SPHN|nr:aldose epimerase family protein [Polymorphobacter multimanifer]MBB6227779.1 aldose 1-epimerase [Polymorphobacter multimanifer]GGI76962.1 aldose 1-epimerase [Polymorphobacter multimanifer]